MDKKAECNKKRVLLERNIATRSWKTCGDCILSVGKTISVYKFLNPAGERRDYIHQALTDVIVVSLAAVKG